MKKIFQFFAFIALLVAASMPALAQEPAVPLDQNFSSPAEQKEAAPKNAEEYAALHFKRCVAREHGSFTNSEVELICGCSASNMTGALTLNEMILLTKRSRDGDAARAKFLTFAYAPCLKYLVTDMTRTDCFASDVTKKVSVGKRAVCKCTADKMVELFERMSPDLIISEVAKNSMTLDPLDAFLSSESYFVQRDDFIRECIYDMAYKRENRQ